MVYKTRNVYVMADPTTTPPRFMQGVCDAARDINVGFTVNVDDLRSGYTPSAVIWYKPDQSMKDLVRDTFRVSTRPTIIYIQPETDSGYPTTLWTGDDYWDGYYAIIGCVSRLSKLKKINIL